MTPVMETYYYFHFTEEEVWYPGRRPTLHKVNSMQLSRETVTAEN